jgi:hypothetical protein
VGDRSRRTATVDEDFWPGRPRHADHSKPAPVLPILQSAGHPRRQRLRLHDPDRPGADSVAALQAPGASAARSPIRRETLRRTVAQCAIILSLSQDFDAAFGTSKLLEVLVLSVGFGGARRNGAVSSRPATATTA